MPPFQGFTVDQYFETHGVALGYHIGPFQGVRNQRQFNITCADLSPLKTFSD
jgi:hypothetical protein